MHFPALGDNNNYEDLAASCSSSVMETGRDIFTNCYHSIRPAGIVFYHSIPSLFTSDPVSRNYLMLLLNLLMLVLTTYAFFRMTTAGKSFFATTTTQRDRYTFYVLSLIILLLMLVAHLPVYLSDLPALSLYSLGLLKALVAVGAPIKQKNQQFLVVGLFLGAAGLLKQNYMAYGGIAGLAICYLATSELKSGREKILEFMKRFFWFGMGFTVIFVQFLWIYTHEGIFWAYLPSSYEGEANRHRSQPILEMVIYTIPNQTAYLSQLGEPVDRVTFYITKIFLGLFKFDIAVYMGKAPFPPPEFVLGARQIFVAYLAFAAYCTVTLMAYAKGPMALRYLSLVALGYTLFTAVSVHTEFRYYVFPRIILYFSIIYFAVTCITHIKMIALSRTVKFKTRGTGVNAT